MINVDNKYFKLCLGTSCVIGGIFIIIILLNSIIRGDVIEKPLGPPNNFWVPTEDDIIQIDSLYNKVKNIEADVDTLHNSVDRIDQKLDDLIEEQNDNNADDVMNNIDMDCGESDEYVMWIGDNGDTIWE